jgi:hypothetical protein
LIITSLLYLIGASKPLSGERELTISPFRVQVFLAFFIFLFTYQVLVPNGDEPDYYDRVQWLKELDRGQYNPTKLVAKWLDVGAPKCQTYAYRDAFWSKLDLKCVSQNIALVSDKFLLALFSPLLIFFVSIWRKNIAFSSYSCSDAITELKKDAVALSLLLPSVIYFFSLQSEEVLAGSLSILAIHFIKKLHVAFLLWALVYHIDDGFAFMLLFFITTYLLVNILNRFFKLSHILLLGAAVILTARLGQLVPDLMLALNTLTGNDKFILIQGPNGLGYELKHDPLMYWIMFFGSGIFMTADGLKSYPAYALMVFLVVSFFQRRRVVAYRFDEMPVLLGASILSIVSIVTILPNYAFAKYYYFLAPIPLYYLIYHLGRVRILKYLVVMNLLTFLNLLLYYI